MKVVTYVSTDAPAGISAMAVYVEAGELLPVRHLAPTEEEARAKAHAWWEREAAKALAKLGRIEALKARKRRKRRKPEAKAESR